MCNVEISKNLIKETAKLQLKKYRDLSGLFIAEGQKILDEMIEKNIFIKEVFSLKKIENSKINAPIYIVSESDMKKITSTSSVCEIAAVAKKQNYKIENLKELNNLILLDNISDPGNLGTIIRSAAAFNIEGIILFGDCVDLYSPKVIRSCAGNFFKIPILHINSIDELKENFKNHQKIATALSKTNNIELNECREIKRRIIMFGSEAKGLNKNLINMADKNIKLEMQNGVDSLNLAVCASIVMWETKRK